MLKSVEHRLRTGCGQSPIPRRRSEQRCQCNTLEAVLAGKLDGRKERGARRFDAVVGRGELRCGQAHVGSLIEDVRWESGRDRWYAHSPHHTAAYVEILRCPANQHSK